MSTSFKLSGQKSGTHQKVVSLGQLHQESNSIDSEQRTQDAIALIALMTVIVTVLWLFTRQ